MSEFNRTTEMHVTTYSYSAPNLNLSDMPKYIES